jgi:hypothetical protein
MSLADGKCSPSTVEKAARFHGREHRVSLSDVIIGHGESRNAFLARRRVGRRRHQLLFFELSSSSRLDGFFVRPESVSKSDQPELSLSWRAPQSQWNDERALSMAARVMYNLSRVGERDGATPLGLEVKGRRVWIHTKGTLRGDKLDRFVEDAMRLRRLLLMSLERANDVSRPATRVESGPASSRVSVVRS